MGGGGGGGWSSLGDIRGLEEKAKEALRRGKRNVFISFAAEDIDEVNLLRGQAKNENSDIEFNDHSVREPYNSERAPYIKERITERIQRSSMTVVYISEHTAESKWVAWEIERSLELGKKVIAVHPGDNLTARLPDAVTKNAIKVVPWSRLNDELQ